MSVERTLSRLDVNLLTTAILIATVGCMLVYSATHFSPDAPLFRKQIIWTLIGIVLMITLALAGVFTAFGDQLSPYLPDATLRSLEAANHLVSLAVITVLIAVLYLVVARLARLRAADWPIVGYALALVGVATLYMMVEGVQFLRDHVPSHLGVPTAATAPAQPRA